MATGIITRRGGSVETFVEATGGTETEIVDNGQAYRVHTFTSVGTSSLNVTSGGLVDYLVIAGGGAGSGRYYGGGGGAGGYRCSVSGELSGGGSNAENPLKVSPQSYTVIVGDGGKNTKRSSGRPGEDSEFGPVVSTGGSGGGTAAVGGSGGGSSRSSHARTPGLGIPGQGNDGAEDGSDGGRDGGGGGGGAGTEAPFGGNVQSNGGDGLTSSITGSAVTRGGGGAGAHKANDNYYQAIGGTGGGGNGGADFSGPTVQPQDGATNTGGGGGAGCWNNTGVGADGGSGIVIVRYPISG